MSGRFDQNFHLHSWWTNYYTYGPGLVLVRGNEAMEPLNRAKPKRLTMIKSLPLELSRYTSYSGFEKEKLAIVYEILNKELGNDLSVSVHTHMKCLQKHGMQS